MILFGGNAVTGDGKTVIPNAFVKTQDKYIVDIGSGSPPISDSEKILDATNTWLLPGLINTHAHGVVPGPFTPVAKPSFTPEKIREEQAKHLMAGETTVLNLCGFCLKEEIERYENNLIRVKVATSHLPTAVKAALMVDGSRLTQRHHNITAEQRLDEGAVAIGEIGAGHLLGGGGQDYDCIPRTINRLTGINLRADQARALKWAVLGKRLSPTDFDPEETRNLMNQFGLANASVETVRDAVCNSVLPPLNETMKGFEEAAALSHRIGVPAILHNCPLVVSEILRLAKRYPKAQLIAAHSNQADFEIDEAISWARRLREQGVIVDVSTWDSPGKAIHADPEKFLAILGAGVVDTVSTDYAGGEWEPIINGLAMAVRAKVLSIAQVVTLATGNPARLLPEVADGKGVIVPGNVADMVLVEQGDMAKVRQVILEGKLVIFDGQLVQQ
jgi:predicted amidohydrolase